MRLAYAYPEHVGLHRARLLQAAATMKALAAEGAAVDFVVGGFGGLPGRLAELGLDAPGITARPVAMWQKGPGKAWPLSWHGVYHRACLKCLRALAAGAEAPRAVLVRHLKLADYLLTHWRAGDVPVLYEAHELFGATAREEGAAGEKLAALEAMERRVLSGAHGVVAISRPLAAELEVNWRPGGAVPVAPSGVDESFFEPTGQARRADLVAYAGGLGPWKGVDTLVRAMEHLPDARLEILGGEPGSGDWQALARVVTELGLEGRVTMRPRAGREEVRALLGRAAVAVWPGTARQRIAAEFTSPLKLFEYMAAGCAIAAPDVPAARAIVEPGRQARLFEPDNPRAMAEAIGALLADEPERMAMGAAAGDLAWRYTWRARAGALLAAVGEIAP